MIKTIRKWTSAIFVAMAVTCAISMALHWTSEPTVAQTELASEASTDSKFVLAQTQPKWRYTRFGWQDANEWATVGQIEHPPARRFDHLHPVVLAMLILFSVLVSVFWASNEWELAQFEFSKRDSDESVCD